MEYLVKWVTVNDMAHIVVEQKQFRELILYVANCSGMPQRLPSGDTVQASLMKQYNESLFFLKEMLTSVPGKISLTMDAWSASDMRPFLAITAHWVTTDWKFVNTLLDFKHFPCPHTGANMCEEVMETLRKYGITHRILGTPVLHICVYL
jgi:predicted PP-loop superfamily ATPase